MNENEMMQSTIETLCELERLQFFGMLDIKFEAGRVVLLRKTETIKPTFENCGDSRGNNDGRQR